MFLLQIDGDEVWDMVKFVCMKRFYKFTFFDKMRDPLQMTTISASSYITSHTIAIQVTFP